ncbi:hypothetical protein CRUP_010611 [Coryphaenoides rupestris]|nr:hypothetical protein CRUP_010611 [Coryphaenoides rupestris]
MRTVCSASASPCQSSCGRPRSSPWLLDPSPVKCLASIFTPLRSRTRACPTTRARSALAARCLTSPTCTSPRRCPRHWTPRTAAAAAAAATPT